MALFSRKRNAQVQSSDPIIANGLDEFSIEVMPRTAAKVDDFRAILPTGTRVYIAHIDGTPIEDMVETAKRIHSEGFDVMPHFAARSIENKATLEDWIARYQGEADVKQGLILAGGISEPRGDFDSSMQLLETGVFEKSGFTHLHVAGHPEGNKDIDADGSTKNVDAAMQWKNDYARTCSAKMALVTQFAFDAPAMIAWAEDVRGRGITLPIHMGVAGPAKLQTLIKFAIACGVGPSVQVLKKRAMDMTKLLLPYEPDDVVAELAQHMARNSDSLIEQIHFFPLGGIKTNAEWAQRHSARAAA